MLSRPLTLQPSREAAAMDTGRRPTGHGQFLGPETQEVGERGAGGRGGIQCETLAQELGVCHWSLSGLLVGGAADLCISIFCWYIIHRCSEGHMNPMHLI